MLQAVTGLRGAVSIGAGFVVGAALIVGFWACGETGGTNGTLRADASDSDGGSDVLSDAGCDSIGDSGGDADVDPSDGDAQPNGFSWVTDPSAWRLIPGTDDAVELVLREAYPDRIGFPALVWESCGIGCEMAQIGQGYGEWSSLPSASTAAHDEHGVPYLQQTHVIEANGQTHRIRRVIRLDDGATVSALRCSHAPDIEWAVCFIGTIRESALALTVSYNTQNKDARVLRGAVVPGAPHVWAQPTLLSDQWPAGLCEFDIDEGRSVFIVGLGAVQAMLDPASSTISVVELPSASHLGVGQGDLAIWTDYDETLAMPPRIRGWTKSGGVQTLIDDLPQETTELAISPSHVVGLMGEAQTAMVTARLWKTPRAYGSADVDLSISPFLPFTPWYGPVKTWGDYAVLTARRFDLNGGSTPTGEELSLIVRLSTWQIWRLDPRSGYSFQQDAVTLTSNHLYVGEKLQGVNELNHLRRVLRFDLEKIDGWAEPL